jgi:hypothetical protein
MRVTNSIPLGCSLPLTICTINCVETRKAGPTIGGLLYDIPKRYDYTADELWGSQLCFQLPFLLVSFLCLIVTLFVFSRFANVQSEADEKSAPMVSVLTVKRTLSLVAIALNGTIVATLDPTLSNKLIVPSGARFLTEIYARGCH